MDILIDLTSNFILLTEKTTHSKESLRSQREFMDKAIAYIQAGYSQFHSLYKNYIQSEIERDNEINSKITFSMKDLTNRSFSHEMHTINRNTYILSHLEKQNCQFLSLAEQFSKELQESESTINSIIERYDSTIAEYKDVISEFKELTNDLNELKSKYFQLVNEREQYKRSLDHINRNSHEYKSLKDEYLRIYAGSQATYEQLKYEIKKRDLVFESVTQIYGKIAHSLNALDEERIKFEEQQLLKFSKFLGNNEEVMKTFNVNLKGMIQTGFLDISNKIEGNSKKADHFLSISFKQESLVDIEKQALILSTQNLLRNLVENEGEDPSSLAILNTGNHNRISKRFKIDGLGFDMIDSNEFLVISKYMSEEDIELHMKNFWMCIISKEEINVSLMVIIMNLLGNEPLSGKILLDIILPVDEAKPVFFRLYNYHNMRHLSNAVNALALIDSASSPTIFGLIFIAEKTFYQSEEGSKTYLCSVLSENKLFHTKKFWRDLFKMKYSKRIENGYLKIYDKLISLNTNANQTITIAPTSTSTKKNSDSSERSRRKSSGLFSKLKSIFSNDQMKSVKEDDEKITQSESKLERLNTDSTAGFLKDRFNLYHSKNSAVTGINFFAGYINEHEEENYLDYIDNFLQDSIKKITDNPNKKQLELLEGVRIEEGTKVIKSFITHICNFSFDISDGIELVLDICTRLGIPTERLTLFVNLLNTSIFSVKCANSLKKHDRLQKSLIKKSNDLRLQIAMLTLPYLTKNDTENLSLSCRTMHSRISKRYWSAKLDVNQDNKYYKVTPEYDLKSPIFIRKFMKKRIMMWCTILKVNILKKEVDYNAKVQLLTNLEESRYIEYHNRFKRKPAPVFSEAEVLGFESKFSDLRIADIVDNFNIINLDVNRTYFSIDVVENRKRVNNILKALVLTTNSKSYCQGMNYVVSFILFITDDEELSFYLFYALYCNSDFGLIFSEDLVKLRQYFYIFDRLLVLYNPEINSYLFHNNIGSSYYCSPWFMTLFTNCYQTHDETLSLVLVRIWDEFILNGWKTLIKTAIVLLLTYEEKILSLKYEDMLNFLFNDVLRSGFFDNANFFRFLNMWEKVSFPDSLFSNLENEYYQESRVIDVSSQINKLLDTK